MAAESFDNTQLAQLVGAAVAENEQKGGENLKTLAEISTKLDARTDGSKFGQALPSGKPIADLAESLGRNAFDAN